MPVNTYWAETSTGNIVYVSINSICKSLLPMSISDYFFCFRNVFAVKLYDHWTRLIGHLADTQVCSKTIPTCASGRLKRLLYYVVQNEAAYRSSSHRTDSLFFCMRDKHEYICQLSVAISWHVRWIDAEGFVPFLSLTRNYAR